MRDVTVHARGIQVDKCIHCPTGHFVDWDETTIYPTADRITAMWKCPTTREPSRFRITASMQVLGHSLGATLIDSLDWTPVDEALLAAEVHL